MPLCPTIFHFGWSLTSCRESFLNLGCERNSAPRRPDTPEQRLVHLRDFLLFYLAPTATVMKRPRQRQNAGVFKQTSSTVKCPFLPVSMLPGNTTRLPRTQRDGGFTLKPARTPLTPRSKDSAPMLTEKRTKSNILTTIKTNYKIITKIAADAKDTAICEKTT